MPRVMPGDRFTVSVRRALAVNGDGDNSFLAIAFERRGDFFWQRAPLLWGETEDKRSCDFESVGPFGSLREAVCAMLDALESHAQEKT